MASISTYLQKILSAVYGEEVRGSIHDALAAMNKESSNAIQFASTAKDSAQAAASSAQASAALVAQKAEEISASAEAAKKSANSAKTSETNAKASATAAQSAQAGILAAKNDAEAARAAAQAAKNAAEASKAASESARDDAKTSQDAAAASALSAQQYSGKPPKPSNGTWWIWDAEKQDYFDSKIGCELEGPAGVSIVGIQLTSGNHAPGTTDIYTVTMTDQTTYNISVYNGRNGTGSGDVLGISFDLLIPAAGWLNGEITVADDRLLALATYKYFFNVGEASREEFLACGIRPMDITTTGFITFKAKTAPAADLTVNFIRFELSANETA